MENSVFLTDRGLVQPPASSSVRVARLCPPRNASVSLYWEAENTACHQSPFGALLLIQVYICHVSSPVSHNQSSYGPLKTIKKKILSPPPWVRQVLFSWANYIMLSFHFICSIYFVLICLERDNCQRITQWKFTTPLIFLLSLLFLLLFFGEQGLVFLRQGCSISAVTELNT